MAKLRVEIPEETSAQVLFESDRTCCVCYGRGKSVQIHHLDEDPSNNRSENLAVLCLECHDKTLSKGGFGRKLDAEQIKLYRSDWLNRVRDRREATTRIISKSPILALPEIRNLTQNALPNQAQLLTYLSVIPALRREARRLAQPAWDAGVSVTVMNGTYTVINVMESILDTLIAWYPPGHFEIESPGAFLDTIIAARFRWHRFRLEPLGGGTEGAAIRVAIVAAVLDDVETMVKEMATSLCGYLPEPEPEEWRTMWDEAAHV